jgi:hypothetical protein
MEQRWESMEGQVEEVSEVNVLVGWRARRGEGMVQWVVTVWIRYEQLLDSMSS